MMWRSRWCGWSGRILGALVWVAPVSGWTGPPKKKPNEARLREAKEIKEDYERLYREGKYGEARAPKGWAVFIVSGDDEPLEISVAQKPHLVKTEEGPPEPTGRGGCATKSSGRGGAVGSMFVALPGLMALRRRGR